LALRNEDALFTYQALFAIRGWTPSVAFEQLSGRAKGVLNCNIAMIVSSPCI
jgi:hypothetical protein